MYIIYNYLFSASLCNNVVVDLARAEGVNQINHWQTSGNLGILERCNGAGFFCLFELREERVNIRGLEGERGGGRKTHSGVSPEEYGILLDRLV